MSKLKKFKPGLLKSFHAKIIDRPWYSFILRSRTKYGVRGIEAQRKARNIQMFKDVEKWIAQGKKEML